MAPSAIDRARHIKDSIDTLRREVGDASLDEIITRPLDWAGFKYLLLIVSEAARQLPAEWQATFGPEINRRRVADLANTLRHAYHSAHTTTLWNI